MANNFKSTEVTLSNASETDIVAATSNNQIMIGLNACNTSTTTAETIRIERADDDNDFAILGAGEFAFFPWSATHDLRSESASGTPTMEVRVYQVTA